jgi:hypothetical protein
MNSAKAEVFVSHCGKEGDVRLLLDALERAFGEDFKLLTDEREIRAGGPVVDQIGDMIRNCHAAIVIVNKRALTLECDDNRWVFTEASRLQDRFDAIDVIPVFVEGVTADAIKIKAWEPTGLNTRLGRSGGRMEHAATDFADVAALAEHLVDDLQPTLRRVRSCGVRDRISLFLKNFDVETLKRAAAPLEDRWGWRDKLIAQEVAERLLAADPGDRANPNAHYGRVLKVLATLAPHDLDAASLVLRLALPFTWVDADAAARIPAAVTNKKLVALNTLQSKTPDAYAVRHADWPLWNVCHVDPASDTEYVKTRRDIKTWLDKIDDRRAIWEGVEDYDLGFDLVVVVCTRLNAELVEVLDEHLADRPDIGVVYLVGDLEEADVTRYLDTRFVYVEPKLDRGVETRGLTRWERAPDALTDAVERDLAGLRTGGC